MLKKAMMVLQLLFLITLLTACSSSPKIIEVPVIVEKKIIEKEKIQNELLECKDFPQKKDYKKQSDVANLLTDVWSVALDCKNKLEKIKQKQEE